MTSLETIDLSNNHLPVFPESLVYLEELSSIIYCQENGIHIDRLPDDFVQLSNLKILDLSHNTFYEIPQIIYSLNQLEYLNMSYNLLTALETTRLKQMKNLKEFKLNGNQFPSFPAMLYQLDKFDITENDQCIAPPNDFIRGEYISAISNQFVQINDQYEEKLFEIYKQICIENLSNSDIERLLIRMKLSNKEMNNFRTNYHQLKREEKIEILFQIWKQKRNSLANCDTLYKLTQLIGDKKLIQQMKKAYLLAGRIRI
jgi:Leucine-rich repeat (LRR) protein